MKQEVSDERVFCGAGKLVDSHPEFDNLDSAEAIRRLQAVLGQQGIGGYALS